MQANDELCKASWYVVQAKPKQEFRALENLCNQGYTCFLPTLEKQKSSRGKLQKCIEPLFARYLFIRLGTTKCNWFPIRSTRGVSSMLAFGERFATIPDDWVEALRNTPGQKMALLNPGEKVVIIDGPFAGLEGIFQMEDGNARAMVLIELMQQPQKLKFSIDNLRKAA